jgi:glycerol-3-phosphate dehydrogenase
MHRISDGARSDAENLISVLGEITGYRAIAEKAIDAVCSKLNVNAPCLTARNPLPSARADRKPTDRSSAGLKDGTIAHLFNLDGSRSSEIIEFATSLEHLREPLSTHTPDVAAQVIFDPRTEQCAPLVDFLLRRTLLGFSQDQGQSTAAAVASLLAQELLDAWAHDCRDGALSRAHRHDSSISRWQFPSRMNLMLTGQSMRSSDSPFFIWLRAHYKDKG